MKKFYVDDCPEHLCLWDWIADQTKFSIFQKASKPKRSYPDILAFKIKDWNPEAMAACIDEALQMYGDHGWITNSGSDKSYTGFSLVYNPEHQDGIDPNASTLGTPKNAGEQFFWGSTQNHDTLKNSYFDTLGFNCPSPASTHGLLGDFLSNSLRQRVRSRVSVVHGNLHNPEKIDTTGWHKDEIIWQNLRINIPVTTSDVMKFQFENKDPVHLDLGWAYSFDSHIAHRVFSAAPDDCRRIHIVLGFCPWFDYLPEERAWVPNKFFGKKHPFDMLVEGDIFAGLEYDPDKVLK